MIVKTKQLVKTDYFFKNYNSHTNIIVQSLIIFICLNSYSKTLAFEPLVQEKSQETINTYQQLIPSSGLPLSPGDTLKITIAGDGGKEFNGNYIVNINGNLEIPYIDPLPVVGLNTQQVQVKLKEVLINKDFFKPRLLNLSVQILEFAPVQVTVRGEVFEPGRIIINKKEQPTNIDTLTTVGDNPLDRYLTVALQTVNGVKPTADISKIYMIRQGKKFQIDLSGILTGEPIQDVPLVSGDEIIVPSSGTFQKALVRPSQITPQEIGVFVSNITSPNQAKQSSQSSNISGATTFKYGIRLSHLVVSAQCVGGTSATNARRSALLLRNEPITGKTKTIQRSVEELVKKSGDSEEFNPFLMPNDAVACYDSKLTNVEGVFNILNNILNPFNLLRNIFR